MSGNSFDNISDWEIFERKKSPMKVVKISDIKWEVVALSFSDMFN